MEFDGIDLEDLAGSESPIIDTSEKNDPTSDPDEKNDPQLEGGKGEVQTSTEDPDGIDLDFLANAGEDPEDTTGGSKNGEEGDNNNGVPAASTDGKSAATSSSQNTFTSLASALIEAGTLSPLEDNALAAITDASTLLAALDNQVKQNEFSGLTDIQKNYLKALEAGVPHDTFVHVKANAAQYESITDEILQGRTDLQAELIRRTFLTKGFTAEKANHYAGLAMKGDDPLKEAIESRNALVAFENSKLEEDMNARTKSRDEEAKAAEKAIEALKSKVTETSEVIPGFKVTSQTREKIFGSMTTPTKVRDKEPLNEVMEKYESDNEYKMRLHALHVMTDGFKDFSRFTKTIKSSAVQKLEETVNNQRIVNTGHSMASNVVSASQIDIAEELRNLKL